MDVNVTAARATGAYGLLRAQIPNAHLESEIFIGQRADWADVHDISGIFVTQLLAGVNIHFGMVSTVENT